MVGKNMSDDVSLHRGQSKVIKDLFIDEDTRYVVVNASRGFGKTYLAAVAAMVACQELMDLPEDVPNKNVAIIAPTYSQGVDIYFPLLAYILGLEEMSVKSSRAAGTFWLPNNVILKIWSYEASERMRGSGQYFVVADEVCSWKGAGSNLKESWESVIQPCIATRWSEKNAKRYGAKPGRALIISTPMGYNYFYEMYNRQDADAQWKSYTYTYHDSPYLDDDEIERVKLTLDPLKFAREYSASFEDSGNTVFYTFNRKEHIDKDLPAFETGEDVHVAIDFNVGIMASCAFALRGNQIHILDEFQGHPDTETLASALATKYKGHRLISYPDPSGRSRKSSAAVGQTDFTILNANKIATRAHNKAPPIIDSVAAVNKKFKNANGDIDMYIHPRCVNTIKSIERTAWVESNPDTATICKKEGVEHWTDGLRYAVEYLFPVRGGTKVTTKGFGF
jgi:hypothetical protein